MLARLTDPRTRALSSALVLTLGGLTACIDNPTTVQDGGGNPADSGNPPADGGLPPDSGTPDSGPVDAGEPDGGEADAGQPDGGPTDPTPRVVPISAAGRDGFYGVTFGPDGSIFATGESSPSADGTGDFSFVLAKFNSSGELDTSFGTQGIATKNVAVGGKAGERARGVVVQSTGKVVIAGTVEHDVSATGTAANDRDIALVRFNADGSVDTTFGTQGVVIFDLSTGVETAGSSGATLSGADAQWSLSLAPGDKLVVHGNQRAEGFQSDGTTPRSDTDWVVLKLNADGTPDTAFGTQGKFLLDIDQKNGSARNAVVLPDGAVIGAGYANTPTGGNTTQAVVYKLTPQGQLDSTFGNGGVFHETVLLAATEAYGAAAQGAKFVTNGYGRSTTSESLDWVSLRLTATGELDTTWGNNGVVRIDVAGLADNGRTVAVLPDNRVLLGGGGTTSTGNMDAMLAVLLPNGQPDTSFGANGYQTFELGGPSDFFWAVAVSPDRSKIVAVGLKGAGNTDLGASNNDDAAILVLPITEPAPRVVPLSPTGRDGFYGVAFGADGSIFATGETSPSADATGDFSFVLAKFQPDGELDTTFGTGGVATKNVAVGGKAGERARGVVVQSTGKVVIAGTVEHDVNATGTAANDRDVALVRFNTDGTVDTTFGTQGVVIFDLSTGVETTGSSGPTLSGADAQWSLSLAPNDKLVVHGNQRAEGFQSDGTTPRTDTDWVVLKLNADGTPDTTFGVQGRFMLDIDQKNGSARGATVLPDGSVIAAGYANTPTGGNTTQAVVYKLTPTGSLDPSFGNSGVFHETVLLAATEAYAAEPQGSKLVTNGYGRNTTSESLDFVSLRLTSAGALDTTWGDNGVVRIDVAGQADNGRTLAVLPDQTVMLGGGGTTSTGNMDAMLALLTVNGVPDTNFGTRGFRTYDLGGASDFFWAVAVSPDRKRLVAVGLKGAGSSDPGPTKNDDAAILVLPLVE